MDQQSLKELLSNVQSLHDDYVNAEKKLEQKQAEYSEVESANRNLENELNYLTSADKQLNDQMSNSEYKFNQILIPQLIQSYQTFSELKMQNSQFDIEHIQQIETEKKNNNDKMRLSQLSVNEQISSLPIQLQMIEKQISSFNISAERTIKDLKIQQKKLIQKIQIEKDYKAELLEQLRLYAENF